MLHLPASILGPLVLDLGLALPDEGCGLLIGQGREVTRWEQCRNDHPVPRVGFRISAQELERVRATLEPGFEITAIVHSHPTVAAEPSRSDRRRACILPALIVSFAGEEPTWAAWCWNPSGAWRVQLAVSGLDTVADP